MADNVRAVVICEDVFLVLAEKDDPNNWKLPGGSVEGGESPEEAIARELMEELGFNVQAIQAELKFKKLRTDDGENNRYIFTINIEDKSLVVPSAEIEKIVWCNKGSVPEGKNKNHILAAYETAER